MTATGTSEPATPRSLLLLVRDVVAVANAGGGDVTVDAPDEPIDADALAAAITDHVGGETVELGEPVVELDQDRIRIPVPAHPTPPLVMSRNTDSGTGRGAVILRKGEVYVRHGKSVRHANRADFLAWTDRAVAAEGARWQTRIALISDIPPGSNVRVLPTTGDPFDEPTVLLDRALTLWRADPSRLLSGSDLVVLFLARAHLPATEEVTELVVASALRRRPTLWFWLAERRPSADQLRIIFDALISGGDRDKTDAGRSLVDVAALMLEAPEFTELLGQLSRSRYRHFQQAADGADRITVLDRLTAARDAKVRKRPVSSFGSVELVTVANTLAGELRAKPSSSRSRQLTTIGLELFARDLEAAMRSASV